ncbi:MAG: CoA ester lyase [Gammaproteobacteria bacterium]|nr:MAG: CoA ester lyase [Gammaproteobacteria bacterium]
MSQLLRSVLYLPASNARALARAPTLPADAIILDLEDAVGPAEKPAARAAAAEAIGSVDFGHRLRVVRINAPDTPWHDDDLTMVKAAKPDAVLLPKVESAATLETLAAQLGDATIAIWAMMETPRAVLAADAIAAAVATVPALTTLVVGSNDLRLAARMPASDDRRYLLPWLMQLVAAARTHGLALVDAVYNDFRDLDGLAAECAEARAMGMDGKTLIHPSQIAAANATWTPDAAAVESARAIVAAFAAPENREAGVLQIDGRMVERLHLVEAQALLGHAEAIAARSTADDVAAQSPGDRPDRRP